MKTSFIFVFIPVICAFQIEFSIVYHYNDVDILTAVRFAATRLVETNPELPTTRRLSSLKSSSPAASYRAPGPKQRTKMDTAKETSQSSSNVPRLVFHEVATDFDNIFTAADEICKLLESNKLIILIGYRLEHLAILRSYSRQFRIPLILLDTGLDRASELLSINVGAEQERDEQMKLSPTDHEMNHKRVGSTGGETPSQYELQFGIPYINALYKVLMHKGWTSFYVIHDTEDGLRRLHAIFQRLSMAGRIVETKIQELIFGEEYDIADDLKHYHRDATNLLIDIRNSTALACLVKSLKDNDLFTDQMDYIFVGLNFDSDMEDIIGPIKLRGKVARISGFQVVSRGDHQTDMATSNAQKIFRDWRNLDPELNPGAGTARLMANQAFAVDFVTVLANVLKRWLINDPASFANLSDRGGKRTIGVEAGRCMGRHVLSFDVGPEIVRRLKAATMSRSQSMTGHLQFNEQGERIGYTVYYHGQENLRVGFRRLGRYTNSTYEYITAGEDRKSRNRTKIDNSTRIVTTIGVEPFLKLKDDHLRRVGNDRFEGYIADLTHAVAELAKFKYEIRLVGDNAYGSQNATGHWNGMMGEVIYGVADMAIAPLTITATREKVVDFTKPFMTLGISIQIKKPQKTKPSVFSFLDPLSYEIWLCIGFAYIGVSVVLFLVARFSPYEWHEDENGGETNGEDFTGTIDLGRRGSQNSSSSGEGSYEANNDKKVQQALLGKETNDSLRYSLPAYCYDSIVNNIKGGSDKAEKKEKVDRNALVGGSPSTSSSGSKKNSVAQLDIRKKYANDFTFSNALWFSLGAFLRQDVDISPRCVSGRMVGSVWWFFTLIIISSYTANLAAFLTVERMSSPIESAEDLAKQTDIKYGTLRRGSTAQFFQTSKSSTYQRMWAYMASAEPTVFVDVIDDGIRRVRKANGKYAFLLESTMNDFVNSRKPCDTMKVGINLDSKGYGIATPKGSDLKELLNLAVLELREKGALMGLEKKWWVEKGECDNLDIQRKDQSQNALTLPKVAGVFYILIGGLALAMVASLCEFLYRAKLDAQKQNLSLGEIVRQQTKRFEQTHMAAAAAAAGEESAEDKMPLGVRLMTSGGGSSVRQRNKNTEASVGGFVLNSESGISKTNLLAQSSLAVV